MEKIVCAEAPSKKGETCVWELKKVLMLGGIAGGADKVWPGGRPYKTFKTHLGQKSLSKSKEK